MSMRWFGFIIAISVGCRAIEDGSSGDADESGTMSVGSVSSGSGSGSGSATSAGAGSENGGECQGEFLCAGIDDESVCVEYACCRASYGRVYAEQAEGWCLGQAIEYAGCSYVGGNDDCDFIGTIACGGGGSTEPLVYVEFDAECFPNGCVVGQPPEPDAPECPA